MSNRKHVFFSSDLHLGHTNVLKYSRRPFVDCEQMRHSLIKRFNATIPKSGVCYFLGDMGMNLQEIKKFVDAVHFDCILISGNHDNGYNTMYNAGFKAVFHTMTMVIAKQVVSLSHCPLTGVYREDCSEMKGITGKENWHKEEKFRRFSIAEHDGFHLHGHIHSPNGGKSEVKLGRQWDVGVDGNGYLPVSLSQVESWIAKTLQKEKEERES